MAGSESGAIKVGYAEGIRQLSPRGSMRYLLTLLLSLYGPCALAHEWRICVDLNEWVPYTYPYRDGTLQILVKMTATRLGQQVSIVPLPWRRCQSEVAAGHQDGMLAVAANDYNLASFIFPRRGNEVDTSRAVVNAPFVLLRRSGSDVSWDGHQIRGLQGPVLYPHGYVDIAARLAQLGIAGESSATTNEQNAKKLLAGRAQLMVIYQGDAQKLLALSEFTGLLEQLPEPLGASLSYLAVGKDFYLRNSALQEQFWNELLQTRQSEAYRRAVALPAERP